MFYVYKRIAPQLFSIMDSTDGVAEECSVSQIKKYLRMGIDIKGVVISGDKLAISVYREDTPKEIAKAKILSGNSMSNGFITSKDSKGGLVLEQLTAEYIARIYSNTKIPSLYIPDGITAISSSFWNSVENALRHATNYSIRDAHFDNIILPDSMTELGTDDFNCCNANTLVTSDKVTNIERYTFRDANINSIHINADCILQGNAFGNMGRVGNVRCLSSTIPSSCFDDSKYLVNVELPNVKVVTDNSFDGCNSLKAVICSDKIEYIGEIRSSFTQSLDTIAEDSFSSIYDAKVMFPKYEVLIFVGKVANPKDVHFKKWTEGNLKYVLHDCFKEYFDTRSLNAVFYTDNTMSGIWAELYKRMSPTIKYNNFLPEYKERRTELQKIRRQKYMEENKEFRQRMKEERLKNRMDF